MAGDWIKFECSTFEKPEVIAIAEALDIPETQVVGCLLLVWSWFDQQTENGHAASVTKKYIDRKTSVTGFADAMLSTGWLTEKNGLSMPNFDRHNGKSAKKRALTTQRKQRERSRTERDDSVTREEKRRVLTPKSPPVGTSGDKKSPRKDATNPRATGTNPRAFNGKRPDDSARSQIQNTRGPDQLAQVCTRLGLGLPPAGMGFTEAKLWAVQRAERQH